MAHGAFQRIGRVSLPAALLLCALSLADSTRRLEAYHRDPFPLQPTAPYGKTWAAHVSQQQSRAVAAPFRDAVAVERTVRSGDTWGGLLRSFGVSPGDIDAATRVVSGHVDPRRLRPGVTLASYHADGAFRGVAVTLPGEGRLALFRDGTGWNAQLERFTRTVVTKRATGVLRTGLETAVREAGAEATLAYRMADVLDWDLDFNRDLQVGDRFDVLYEEVRLDGRPSGVGQVLAVVYENQSRPGQMRRIEAYRYGDKGYFDREGRPIRKMFLRCPLPFSRITSRFTNRRYHPVLHTYRAHHGVDYGAPTGTPVRVTASGVVTFVGWDRGGGKTIKVRHPNDYETAYLHLSGYARGLSVGDRVAQGDVIGFVGATGLATGPHLDYRVRYRGQWIDPLTIGREQAEPLGPSELPGFLAARDALLAELAIEPPAPAREGIVLAATPTASAAGAEVRARR
jgi:murein DD-endopeptidase MepM/ murein hydrolase activator NlpD